MLLLNNFVSQHIVRNAMCEAETGFQTVLTGFSPIWWGVADHHSSGLGCCMGSSKTIVGLSFQPASYPITPDFMKWLTRPARVLAPTQYPLL